MVYLRTKMSLKQLTCIGITWNKYGSSFTLFSKDKINFNQRIIKIWKISIRNYLNCTKKYRKIVILKKD